MPRGNRTRTPLPGHRYFEAWARFVVRLRALVLLGCGALSAFMYLATREQLVADTRIETLLPRDSPARRALAEMAKDFGSDRTYRVLVEGDVFSPAFLLRLRNLHGDLEALAEREPSAVPRGLVVEDPGRERGWGEGPVRRVTSLINAPRLRKSPDGVRLLRYRDEPDAEADLPRFRAEVLSDPNLVGRVVDAEGSVAVVTVELSAPAEVDLTQVGRELDEVVHLYSEDGFRAVVSGPLAVAAAVDAGVVADQEFLLSAEAVAFLLLMWAIFRHPVGVFGPLLVVAQAAVCMFGWMHLTGGRLTLVSAVLGALVLCLSIGFSLHLQSVYRRVRRAKLPSHEAIVRAVGIAGVPILATTLTSCAALSSFAFARMEAIRNFGLVGSTGVFFAGFFTFTFTPAWLTLNRSSMLGGRAEAGLRGPTDFLLSGCSRLTRRAPLLRAAVLAVVAGVLVASFVGASRLRSQHDPLAWLPSDLPLVRATRVLGDRVGGASILALLVTPRPGFSVQSAEVLGASARVAEHARGFRDTRGGDPLVRGVRGLGELARETGMRLGVPAAAALEGARVADVVGVWEALAPEVPRRLVTLDRARSRVVLQLGWGDSETYGRFTQRLREDVVREMGEVAQVQLAGTADSHYEVMRALLRDLWRSFGTAALVLSLALVAVLRRLRFSLVAVLVSLWPTLGLFGFMGLTGRALDIQTILLAPIGTAIAVDGTVHLLYYVRLHHARHRDIDAAIAYAFANKGRAVLGTSVALWAGFSVLLLGYMGSTRGLGQLGLVTVSLAALGELVLLPVLLRSVYKARPRVEDRAHASSYDMTFSEFF